MTTKENFTSLLYWLGITTITGGGFGRKVFGLPNETLKALASKMIPDAYASIKAKAVEQLDQYSADPALAAEWRLAPLLQGQQSTEHCPAVTLHRLVLVFKGGECILQEEV